MINIMKKKMITFMKMKNMKKKKKNTYFYHNKNLTELEKLIENIIN